MHELKVRASTRIQVKERFGGVIGEAHLRGNHASLLFIEISQLSLRRLQRGTYTPRDAVLVHMLIQTGC